MDAAPEPLPSTSKAHDFRSPAAFYGGLLPALREAAKACGYALAVHGSMQRDFDLIAVPWTEEAVHPLLLVEAIAQACGGYTDLGAGSSFCEAKPHGRQGWVINLSEPDYIDLSVMPRLERREPNDSQAQAGVKITKEKMEQIQARTRRRFERQLELARLNGSGPPAAAN